jgi:O-antigen ligase
MRGGPGLLLAAVLGGVVAVGVGVAAMIAAIWFGSPVMAPPLALVVVVGAIWLPFALRFPDVAVLSLLAVDVAKLSEVAADLVGVGIFQPMLLVAIASLVLALWQGRLQLRWSPYYFIVLILAAVTGVSVLLDGGSEAGMARLIDLIKDLVYLAVVLVWATTKRSWRLATAVLALTMAALAALSVVQEFVLSNSFEFFGLSNLHTTQLGAVTLRHSGPEADANFWARSLTLSLPIALAWWAAAKHAAVKWVAAGAVGAIGLGFYLTQSRGGLISITVAIAIWLLLAGRRYARLLMLAPVVLVLMLAIPGVGSRLTTLAEISDAGRGAGDPSLQGRIGAQEAGVGMFFANPVLGIGAGEFKLTVPEYQRRLGIQAEVLDSHNLYLEIAAETGVIGLAAWGLLFGYALFAALRVILISRLRGGDEDRWNRLMAAGLAAGLLGWLLASVFLHAASLRVMFAMLAITVGMDVGLGGAGAESPVEEAGGGQSRAPWLRGGAVVAVVSFLLVAVAAALMLDTQPQRWVAERQVLVTTGDAAEMRYEAYSQDLITRGMIGATYAAVLEEPGLVATVLDDLGVQGQSGAAIEVSTSYSPALQLITVSATGEDPGLADQVAAGVVAQGTEFIDGLGEPFVVLPTPADEAAIREGLNAGLLRWATIVALGSMVAAAAAWSFWATNRFRSAGALVAHGE